MNKNFILILISLLIIPLVWYNTSRRDSPVGAHAAEVGGSERRFGEEVVACTAEIPIGEAIEDAMRFACQLSHALNNIQQASSQYRQTVKEIADLAGQCSANSCLPSCTPGTEQVFCGSITSPTEICINDVDDDGDGFVDCQDSDCNSHISCGGSQYCSNLSPCADLPCNEVLSDGGTTCSLYCTRATCTANACFGDPCPQRAEIENKYAKLANISRILAKEQQIVNRLLDIERPKIRKKLDEARWLFERHAPTTDLYQLLRGPTTCKIAVNNFWVELEDVQEGRVCKSPYNYLVCR